MRKKHQKTRSLSILLAAAVTVAGITPVQLVPPKKAAAAVTLSDPRTDAEGVSTWDCIYFGNYWQNDTNGDGTADQNDVKEPVKWRVLSVEGDDAFLLADCSLDCKSYNTQYTSVTWETCTLRSWLNGYGSGSNAYGTDYSSDNFIDAAFSPSEQEAIRDTAVVNEDNPYWGTEGGNDTTDKVYLLSVGEACTSSYGFSSEYAAYSDTRISVNTAYAKAQGASNSTFYTSLGSFWWWLRSPGHYSDGAAYVTVGGDGNYYGDNVSYSNHAVRPALHLNLKSTNLYTYAGTVSSDGGSTGGETPAPVPSDASAGSSGLTCKPDLTVEVGEMGTVNARVYAETEEEMKTLSAGVSWSSSDSQVAEVRSGGFIHATSPVTYSGTEGGYSLWYASGLVSVTGRKAGDAVITGELTNGTSVSCRVTVTEPEQAASSGEEGNGGCLELGESREGSADDGKSGVAQFFPATWSLSSTKYPVQLSQRENTDGSYTLKGSIGIGRSDLLDQDTEWSRYKKACETANDTLESYRELYGLKASTAIHSSGWTGKKKPSLSVMGYVEVKSDKYGNIISSEGKIAGDLSWKGDISWQFATPIGPMYLKLGAEGKASLKTTPYWNTDEERVALKDGTMSLTPSISLTGGYGIDKVASISATGKASVEAQVYPPSKGTFKAEASVNVYALFVINHTWTLAEYTRELWNTTSGNKSAGKTDGLGLPQEDLSFMDIGFASADSGWARGRRMRSRQQDMLTLKEGLLPSSLPMLAAIGDKQVMVWQDYDETRNVADSSVLMYSVYEGGTWSEPQAVYDDGYGDACADLQVIDGKVHLTWQKHKAKISMEDADEALSQMAENAEIYYAQFDSDSNAFTQVTQVTDNASCDMMPKFVKGEDTIQIAWVRNDAGSILQSEGTNTIYTAAWNGAGFDGEQMLTESPGTVERYVSYVQDGKTKAMYVTEANDVMAVQSSDNIVAEELGDLMSMAEDATISSIDYAEEQIRLIRNGILYCYDPSTDQMTSYTAGEEAFDNTAVYCTNGTKSGYIWSTYDEETGTGSIVASMSTGTGYSNPVTVCEEAGEISRHMAPVLTKEGAWNIALNQENVQSGIHSLSWLSREEKTDTCLVAAYVNEDDVVNGLTGVDYVFSNTGDVVVDRITVQIILADGTAVQKTISVTAYPGDTIAGTAYMDLSQAGEGQDIRISLYESGQIPDSEDMVSDVIEQSNISLVGTAIETDGTIIVTAYAANQGSRSAETSLSLYGEADRQNLFAEQTGIMVSAGQTESVIFTVDSEQIQYNENNAAYLTLCADVAGGDYDLSDNITYLALYKGEKVDANTSEKGGIAPSPGPDLQGTQPPAPSATPTPKVTSAPEASRTPDVSPKPSAATPSPVPTRTPNSTQTPQMTAKPEPADAPFGEGSSFRDSAGVTYVVVKFGTSNREVAYAAPKNKKIKTAKIPAEVLRNGTAYKVTSIRANAFKNCKRLKKVIIGKNIRSIGRKAFYGCAGLKSITIKTTRLTRQSVGSRAFAELHNRAEFTVPKKKLPAYKRLLKKKGVSGKKQRIKESKKF